MVHLFNHRWGDYALQPAGRTHIALPDVPESLLSDPTYVTQPRYWVSVADVQARLTQQVKWLLGFRDITSATVERTMIAAAFPTGAVGNKLPLLNSSQSPRLTACLGVLLSSFVLDFAARQKLGGTTMNFFVAKQLPVLPPAVLEQPTPWCSPESVAAWVRPRALELTYTAVDMAGFAADLGYEGPPFRWDPQRRRQLRAELDAGCFHLYGLDHDEVDYVMETFPIVRHRDEAAYGGYLTKRLILEQYDAMAAASKDVPAPPLGSPALHGGPVTGP